MPVIFNPSYLSKRVNKTDGEDLILTSACNFYDGVSQKEVEDYYNAMKSGTITEEIPSYGLNSTLCKRNGKISEDVWHSKGKYGAAIKMIVNWLEKAAGIAESEQQRKTIELLIKYYNTGILSIFDDYSIEWLQSCNERIDFVNGFIEVYGDPLGIKGSWEGIVEYKDLEATKRTQIICDNAQWFEDHSPVDSRFKKPIVRGVTANVVCAAMLGGDEYPYTAIGINLPNADWIREKYGSKSVTIGNLTEAYYLSAKNNGFYDEFVVDKETLTKIEQYGCICDDLHTDLHECLGHGSGRILAGVSADALKAYGSTIEEARADLFALYYIADQKLFELGLTPDKDAYKSQYYTYIMNGLMTQLTRIKPGHQIEEAHMRNRALIAQWCLDNGQTIKLVEKNSKTYVQIEDYCELRRLFARLLAEIQRIKSEGDYEAAKNLIERYAVKVDPVLHSEVLQRYKKLNLAPYKGFINPVMLPIKNKKGEIIDIKLDYTESYESQMLRYSRDYAALI
jgi:dipeptidyl-peptidase-3